MKSLEMSSDESRIMDCFEGGDKKLSMRTLSAKTGIKPSHVCFLVKRFLTHKLQEVDPLEVGSCKQRVPVVKLAF